MVRRKLHAAFWLSVLAAIAIAVGVAIGFKYRHQAATLIAPKFGPVVEAVYGLGKVKAEKRYDVRVSIPSTVKSVPVRLGEDVKRGQLLITFREGGIFHSPIDGMIVSLPYGEAETVPPQTSALSVESVRDLYIEVALDQVGALRVQKGQTAQVSFEDMRGQKIGATVTSIVPQDGQFLVRLEPQQMPASVLPGMTADVAVEVGRREQALLVPVAAVDQGVVLRVRGEKREKIKITVGTVDGQWAEVTGGDLSESDFVLVRNK
jgi:multidrug efflux pump subunit AcrA (membrane-fusion protein)